MERSRLSKPTDGFHDAARPLGYPKASHWIAGCPALSASSPREFCADPRRIQDCRRSASSDGGTRIAARLCLATRRGGPKANPADPFLDLPETNLLRCVLSYGTTQSGAARVRNR